MFVPAKNGTQLFSTPINLRTLIGTVPASGSFETDVSIDDVMPAGTARVEFWQLQVTPAGMPLNHLVLGGATAIVVVGN